MANYTIVKSEKRKDQVVHDNFVYNADGQGSVNTYWRCENRSSCNGRGIIGPDNAFVVTKSHSHAAQREKIERKRTVEKLKEAVQSNALQPIQVCN